MLTKIASIETIVVALPLRREHKWAGLTESIGRYVLVRIEDDAGNVGWGEAPALKDWGGEYGHYFGESSAIVQLVVERYLAPVLIGLPVGNFGIVHQRMAQAIKGYPYAKAAVDIACYDLAGRTRGVAVHELLGGAVRDTIPITHSIGLMDADAAEREAGQVADEGIRTIKIKIGIEPTRDVEVVRRVREAVGDRVKLCVDANEGYATPGQAIGAIRRMERFDLLYAEQPVRGIARMAEVARAVDVPITADESVWNAHDILEIVERGAAQIISIYITKPGGLYHALDMAAVAASAGLPCNVNGSGEFGIGNLANVAFAAAAPAVSFSCAMPISVPAEAQTGQVAGIVYKDDVIASAMTVRDGAIVVPQGPGLGIDVDLEKLERYRVH